MNTTPHPFYLFAASALTAFLLSPRIAGAVGIGEVVLQSQLGEPLFAQVELTTASGENIDASCLSLAAPDPQDNEAHSYLLKAKLEIKTEGVRRYVVISSRKPFNELFAKLRLQINCPGIGSITKVLTILPDLNTISPPAASATAEQTSDNNAPANISDNARNTRSENTAQQLARNENSAHPPPGAEKNAPKTPLARKWHGRHTGRQATFRLKLSGEPLDETRIGKISTEERELLLARQKLFDADDQMASFLALQHQVKQLQSELGEIKLKLASLDRPLPAAATPAPPVAGTPESASAPATPRLITAVKKPPVTEQRGILQYGLLAAGLALAITVLLLRRHTRLKSQQAAKPVLAQTAEPAVIPVAQASPISQPARKETQTTTKSIPKETAPQPNEENTEEDSILEEAELYAIYGRPDKAIEILHEIIAQNPAHTEARMLLISILSSLSRVEEFEQAARDFLEYNKNSELWKVVQTLGRTLDQFNPLYSSDGNLDNIAIFLPQMAINKLRPVGDILMDMGVLSAQDLKNYLADFNPKVHGRFGGYLVSRKIITLAQLNEALLKQQQRPIGDILIEMGVLSAQDLKNYLADFNPKVHGRFGGYLVSRKIITLDQLKEALLKQRSTDGTKSGAPTLQDMENFLTDYNSERDGSIGEFLVARNALTPDQLSKVLQQQPGDDNNTAAVEPPPAYPPESDKPIKFDLDFHRS